MFIECAIYCICGNFQESHIFADGNLEWIFILFLRYTGILPMECIQKFEGENFTDSTFEVTTKAAKFVPPVYMLYVQQLNILSIGDVIAISMSFKYACIQPLMLSLYNTI